MKAPHHNLRRPPAPVILTRYKDSGVRVGPRFEARMGRKSLALPAQAGVPDIEQHRTAAALLARREGIKIHGGTWLLSARVEGQKAAWLHMWAHMVVDRYARWNLEAALDYIDGTMPSSEHAGGAE